MSNLLPTEEKKKLSRDRHMRIAIVITLLLMYVGVIFSLGLVPSYVLSKIKEKSVTEELATLRQEDFTKEHEALENVVKDINQKLRVFENQEPFVVSEEVIDRVLSHQKPGISISAISFSEKEEDDLAKIRISGTATTRTVLRAFSESLGKDEGFSDVSLPISDLVKEQNIPFTLNFHLVSQ